MGSKRGEEGEADGDGSRMRRGLGSERARGASGLVTATAFNPPRPLETEVFLREREPEDDLNPERNLHPVCLATSDVFGDIFKESSLRRFSPAAMSYEKTLKSRA